MAIVEAIIYESRFDWRKKKIYQILDSKEKPFRFEYPWWRIDLGESGLSLPRNQRRYLNMTKTIIDLLKMLKEEHSKNGCTQQYRHSCPTCKKIKRYESTVKDVIDDGK